MVLILFPYLLLYIGAYGTVYKVQRQSDAKMFALKKMSFSETKNKTFADAYRAEQQTLVILFDNLIGI
jgi:serine/threonine protein kinase